MEEAGIGWIAAIIIGGFAGWLAEKVTGSNMGLLANIILGMIGAGRGRMAVRPVRHPRAGRVARLLDLRVRRAPAS